MIIHSLKQKFFTRKASTHFAKLELKHRMLYILINKVQYNFYTKITFQFSLSLIMSSYKCIFSGQCAETRVKKARSILSMAVYSKLNFFIRGSAKHWILYRAPA